MKKTLHLFVVCTVLVIFIGCNVKLIVIEGYTNDYDKLNDSLKALVHPLVNFDSLEAENIYLITPELLKAELARHEKSIVYIFYGEGCNSEFCRKPISFYEQFAADGGCQLFVVLTSYLPVEQAVTQKPNVPLFVVDNDYYNERRRFIYERYFLNDLIGYPTCTRYKDIPDEFKLANLFMYEYDKFVGVCDSI